MAEEFQDWRQSPAEVKHVFETLATDGFWDKETFTKFMESSNPHITDEEVDLAFDQADPESIGKLSYDDFYSYFVQWDEILENSKNVVDVRGAMHSSAVFVRVRPLATEGGHAEGAAGNYTFDEFDEGENHVLMSYRGRQRKFDFAKKVLSDCTQEEMYNQTTTDLVNSFLLRQMDVIYLAYGQTGTGKTHTIFGPPQSLDPENCPPHGPHPEWGIFPRVVEYTISTIKSFTDLEAMSTLNHKITVSAMEFYLGAPYDLLNQLAPVFIDVDTNSPTHGKPMGLTEQECNSSRDMLVFLQEVYGNRHTRKTKMNEGSSRSHTILILKIYFCESKEGSYISNSFMFFDLAGAERSSKTGGEMVKMTPVDIMAALAKGGDAAIGAEGAIINLDLTYLCTEVVLATEAAKKRKKYRVPAGLTPPFVSLVANCFDGRALLGMVVCMSQSPQHGSESWFSCTMGEKMGALKSAVKAVKMSNIDQDIRAKEAKLEKAKKNLKEKPRALARFLELWKAQVQSLTVELEILNELRAYDPQKDQVSTFVRKRLGLFTSLECASHDETRTKVTEVFEKFDVNGDKKISLDEFKSLFVRLFHQQECCTAEDLEWLFRAMDKDGDNVIDFDEFFNYMFLKQE